MKTNFPPLQLTVAYPTKPARGRGAFATRGEDAPIAVRLSRPELRQIEKAARKCGMQRMAFMRYAASEFARVIEEVHCERSTT